MMRRAKEKAPAPSKVPGAVGEQLSFLSSPPFCPTWPVETVEGHTHRVGQYTLAIKEVSHA